MDRPAQSHRLLGLACFHAERWAQAARHFAAVPDDPVARALERQSRANAATRVERTMHAGPELDARRLLQPPALWLREPQGLEPLPPESRRELAWRLLRRASSGCLGLLAEVLIRACHLARDRKALFAFESWDRRGTLRGLLELAGIRGALNREKLQSTYGDRPVGDQPPGQMRPAWTRRFRTATGAWTTDDPMEGAAGMALQRSGAPLAVRRDRSGDALPDPRRVSRFILAPLPGARRREAPFVNLLALAWIQAQLHDWVSHSPTPFEGFHRVPLAADDPLRVRYGIEALRIPRSSQSPLPGAAPLTFLNEVTHWWDGSQIYGSDQATQDRLRRADGTLRIDGELLPLHPLTGIEDSGFTRNWWVGLDLIHTLFVKHHNHVWQRLKRAHPGWSGDQLFHTARLIDAAIMAKIHTVEWTPAVLPNAKVVRGMAANWWGFFQARRPFGQRRIHGGPLEPRHPVLGGLAGGRCTNHGKPYGLSEEFAEVYRLHAGIPDEVRIRGAEGQAQEAVPTDATRGAGARALVTQYGMARLLESFGHQHMPALVHNNYPAFMSGMSLEGQPVFDVGTADVLRARERGVPPYNEFRRMLGLKPLESYEQLGCGPHAVAALEEVYGRDGIERMDLIAGTYCELHRPCGFAFGETVFTVFIQMASRRLEADPFYTEKLNARYYTREGMELIEEATFKGVLLQHFPGLGGRGLQNVHNAFEPWGTSCDSVPAEHPLARIERY